jgi:hypothetical protein
MVGGECPYDAFHGKAVLNVPVFGDVLVVI